MDAASSILLPDVGGLALMGLVSASFCSFRVGGVVLMAVLSAAFLPPLRFCWCVVDAAVCAVFYASLRAAGVVVKNFSVLFIFFYPRFPSPTLTVLFQVCS